MASGKFMLSLRFSVQLTVLITVLHLLRFFSGFPPLSWGLLPRTKEGLAGIIMSPLMHGSWGHLFSNMPPLFALSFLLFYFYRRIAWPAFGMIYLLTGAAVWLAGRPVIHIGASGVVYGLVAFMFWSGIFRRNLKSIILALLVLMYYGSMFMGIFPNEQGISWESHLLGALTGIFTAFWFKQDKEEDEQPPRYSWEEESKDEDFFLDRDTFERRKSAR
jgi:membrane associated rhomboid family serine protease